MTVTVVYTPAAHGNRRGGTARVGAGVNMGHRQVTPNQVPCQENEGSVSSSGGGQERMGTSRLNREARVNIRQIIMTLTMLLSDTRHVDGFRAYNCKGVRGTVQAYSLTPLDGCWTEQIRHPPPRHQMGGIFWMMDEAEFPVIYCKLTETAMRADCDKQGKLGMLQVLTLGKQVR